MILRILITGLLLCAIFGCKSEKSMPTQQTEIGSKSDTLSNKTVPDGILEMLRPEQRQLIATLTGAVKINENQLLKRRRNEKEKLLARSVLNRMLQNIGLNAQEHPYLVNLPDYNSMSRHNPYMGTNLYVIIPSTVPSNEYIVIGAHYDTVEESPGASDNATGCALVYGVSKLVAGLENRKKNLIVVFFDQEETGHAGSYAFVNFVKEKAYRVRSIHTADQVGWDQDGDRNIELELPTDYLKSVYEKHAKPFGITVYTTDVTSSDHKEWREAGYNAVGITEEYKNGDTSPHWHEPTDTFETVDFDYLAFVTYLVYKVIEDQITL
jgi:hypothetical protein